MTETIILGADPGITGSIAFFWPRTNAVVVEDMPTADGVVNGAALAAMIREMSPTAAIVEQVASRPGQGVASVFTFGRAYGTLLGVLQACSVPIEFAPPSRWKRYFRLGKEKEEARAKAITLWPDCKDFSQRKDHNRAEAALLARFYCENYWVRRD
jgi:hypothetical protein